MNEKEFFNRISEHKYKKRLDEFQTKPSNLDVKKFDYIINNNTSVRFELIKSIKNEDEKIKQMIDLVKDSHENMKHLPDEILEFIARDKLKMPINAEIINDKKEKYKLNKDQFLSNIEKENQDNKKIDINNNTMKIIETKII
tara:strand:- start:166 stop:591 length:426 start_codon:yes stop_codon:yes gene_type:complete